MTDDERARLLALVETWRKELTQYRLGAATHPDPIVRQMNHASAETRQRFLGQLAALLPPVGQPATSLHIELLALSVCLMRFDELNAGQTVRVIGVQGLVELIDAARKLVARHEAEAPVGQEEPQS